ncbi:MAG: ABC transporter substrate-binding protein, partial [Peptococcaceae bacterium]|nr:ABC transporter substrate-binding protein [Peptococcaceae bacterium]
MFTRKVLAVFITFIFAAGILAGCGGNTGNTTTGGGSTGGTSGGGTSGGGAPASGEPIIVGVNFELSGQLAGYGQTKLNGAKIALEEINAAGGALGRPIKLIEYDNKGDIAEAINISTRLMGEDKVVVMMGPVTSGRVMASIDVAKQFKIPMVTGTGTSPGITVNSDGSINDFVYRICFIDPYQGTLAANYATETLGLKTAAMLVNQSDDYSIYMA